MDPYTDLVRPVLFRMPPETAHRLVGIALSTPFLWRSIAARTEPDPRLAVEMHGLRFANPVGLAPGFDKDCDHLDGLAQLGFGFLAPGSIMRDVRAGNARPRLARLVKEEALINAMGLPSKGLDHALARLAARRIGDVPVMADINGVNPDEIVANLVAVQPWVDALEVTLVCPNAPDTSDNVQPSRISELLSRLGEVRRKPIFVKIPLDVRGDLALVPPFLDQCIAAGVEGVIAAGLSRRHTDSMSIGYGQVSGRPAYPRTLELVRAIAAHTGRRLSIIASGGISTGRDAYTALAAGADAIEIYSALVYRGWRAPALINRELLAIMDAEGIESVRAISGRRA